MIAEVFAFEGGHCGQTLHEIAVMTKIKNELCYNTECCHENEKIMYVLGFKDIFHSLI